MPWPVISRDVLGQAVDPQAKVAKALFHDASEAITGDLPTPVKYSPAMRHATPTWKTAESARKWWACCLRPCGQLPVGVD